MMGGYGMKLKWNLTGLFESNEDFYREFDKVKELLTKIKKYSDTTIDEVSLLEMLNRKWDIKELTNNILIYGSLMYYKNIHSEECIKLKKDAEDFSNEVELELAFIDRLILGLGKEKVFYYITKNLGLNTYKLYLDNLFRRQEHVQEESVSLEIVNNNNEINSQLAIYNNMLRDIEYGEIEIDGEMVKITSSNFAKYLSARDRKTRKQVYITVNQQFDLLKDKFADVINTIFYYRNKNAKLEKYKSVLDKILFEENIDIKIIDSLISAVNNNLFLIQKYLSIKSSLLGIKKPHLYDFGVPLDNGFKKKYSFQDAVEIIKNALKPLGNDYLEVVDELLNGHIDAEPDQDKHQSITFSWHTYSFMNFRGAYVDLKNLVHELGHIVNYYLSKKKLPYIYEDSTIFVGETASIVNEILLNRYLYDNAKTEEEKIFYLSKEIENYFTSVFKQTMYTEFENELYDIMLTGKMSSTKLSSRYYKLIKKYYGKDIVYDKVASVEWTRLGHLFRWSYYPYKYATGLIIASVVVNSLLNDKTITNEQYIEFLSSGSSMYSLDLLKMLNVDLTNPDIIKNGFKVLESDIEKLSSFLTNKE